MFLLHCLSPLLFSLLVFVLLSMSAVHFFFTDYHSQRAHVRVYGWCPLQHGRKPQSQKPGVGRQEAPGGENLWKYSNRLVRKHAHGGSTYDVPAD